MIKKFGFIFLALIIVVLVVILIVHTQPTKLTDQSFDALNSTFIIDGQSITLVNGLSEISIPNSSSKTVTHYFGNEANDDINNDGQTDKIFLIYQNTGGSGTFFYVLAGISTKNGYKTTNPILLGDRISPQSTVITETGEIQVNYVDRLPEEPMTAVPSIGITKTLKLINNLLVEE